MKKKLLFVLSIVVIAGIAVSCTSYTCPTYSKIEHSEECLGI